MSNLTEADYLVAKLKGDENTLYDVRLGLEATNPWRADVYPNHWRVIERVALSESHNRDLIGRGLMRVRELTFEEWRNRKLKDGE
ncbi:hypothetical protein QTI05_24035 [Variovorax sp. J22R193]|uniref:hypothetical protein n=1 Tax=Variovorax fucosicus TaxID=3053517 RepID=UPI002576FCC1|nr:hypothetical protein [Variovorax sp. J22R193]MDM0042129.1 hypothetical protein [Variovorax sp. J22R193]